jgi:hypothetical protein
LEPRFYPFRWRARAVKPSKSQQKARDDRSSRSRSSLSAGGNRDLAARVPPSSPHRARAAEGDATAIARVPDIARTDQPRRRSSRASSSSSSERRPRPTRRVGV